MRISDWSSDVCSSDLIGGCRVANTPRKRAIEFVLFGFDPCTASKADDLIITDRPVTVLLFLDPAAKTCAHRVCIPFEPIGNPPAYILGQLVLRPFAALAPPHTAQSLVRVSPDSHPHHPPYLRLHHLQSPT